MVSMKTSNFNASSIQNVRNVQRYQKTQQTIRISRAEETRDTVALSAMAKNFQAVKNALKDAPDVREEKISEIKSRMDSGTYVIDSKAIAEKMLGL